MSKKNNDDDPKILKSVGNDSFLVYTSKKGTNFDLAIRLRKKLQVISCKEFYIESETLSFYSLFFTVRLSVNLLFQKKYLKKKRFNFLPIFTLANGKRQKNENFLIRKFMAKTVPFFT